MSFQTEAMGRGRNRKMQGFNSVCEHLLCVHWASSSAESWGNRDDETGAALLKDSLAQKTGKQAI